MKTLYSLILLTYTLLLSAQTTFSPKDYCLVWSDEFNVNGLPSTANWRYETGHSIRNNEAQNYTANRLENARVENGRLIIEARRDNYQGHEISSASLVSWGKVVHRYGRFECRAKIDIRSGSWPAFWTLGESGEWPSNGEIDIMEYYQGKLLGNAAWGTETRWQGNWDSQYLPTSSFPAGWANEFHIFMMEWTPNYIRLYVDDVLINDVDLSRTFNGSLGNYSNPFRQPHYLILNQAIGGNNGGSYANTVFPLRYEIDYVRIYQLGNCNLDCSWTQNGTAYLDDCLTCVGGNTGKQACTLTCEGNLIKNAGFESGNLTSWTGWGTRSVANTGAYSGTYAVQVGNGAAEQVVSVLPNTTYTLKMRARKEGGGAVFLGVKEHGAAETNLRIDNNTWQLKEFTFRTGNTTAARIYYYNPEGGTGYGDDFELRPTTCYTITGTQEVEPAAIGLQCYPNPSEKGFNMRLEGVSRLQVYNTMGILIDELMVENEISYGERLVAGTYTLRVVTEKEVKTLSWIKL